MMSMEGVTNANTRRRNTAPGTLRRSNGSSENLDTLDIGSSLRICHLNIEGISKSKCEYLSRLMHEEDVEVIALQETHAHSYENLLKRGTIAGYSLVSATYSNVHGIATYVRSTITNYQVLYTDDTDSVHTLAIKVGETTILNIYKPPNVTWPNTTLPVHSHPTFYIGDFNSHHQAWGYERKDENGNSLFDWLTLNSLHLSYSSKDIGTFRSARWKKEYTPDLSIVTQHLQSPSNKVRSHIIKSFPNSQLRPVILDYGICIPLNSSIPKPRWNFRKADWTAFANDLDHVIKHIPAEIGNYERFVNAVKGAAKRHIPRGFRQAYIPGWSQHCDDLYEEYNASHDNAIAAQLLSELDKQRREKWIDTVENLDFTHSSRRAWGLLNKLGNIPTHKPGISEVTPNAIATRLLKASKAELPKDIIAETKKTLRQLKSNAGAHPTHSRPFTVDEIDEALKGVKTGKAAGPDGIFPEFVKHAGPRLKQWLMDLFNIILNTGRIPKLLKRSNVVAIQKPGKDGTDVAHYRPISLLSVIYKLLERLILFRIQPLINEATPVCQAGFRANRNCTEQVLALTTYIESGFQRQLKTNVVFVDLSSAFDTVWREDLLAKLLDVVPCSRLISLLNNMLSNRMFRVCLGDKSSRWRGSNNGLPQGSVLAPALFNLYVADLPDIRSIIFQYADDMALAHQASSLEESERVLEEDLHTLGYRGDVGG